MRFRQSNATRILAVIAAFMITFTGLPIMSGDIGASALAAPAKVTKLKASSTKNSARLTWKRPTNNQLKIISGIVVFRNGKAIKTLGKKTTAFSDSRLKAGTKYNYVVRTYRTYKQKQWYNKKTKKWQTKAPAKKYRGKTRKVNAKLYGGVARIYVTTKGSSGTISTSSTEPSSDSGSDSLFANSGLSNQTFNLANPPSSARGSNTFIYNVNTSKYVTWSSSNPSVASVIPYNDGKEGCVYINAVGSTTVVAKNWNGQTKSATITVVNNPSGGGGVVPTGKTFKETPERYYEYNGVKIYLGQTWNNTLKAQLTAASDGGTWAGSRKSFIKYYTNANDASPATTYNEDIYFFGTNTYAPFLAVYVVNGQIYQFANNASLIAKIDGASITRGQQANTLPTYASGTPVASGSSNGIRVAWLYATTNGSAAVTNTGRYENQKLERDVMFHFHNAVRAAYGKGLLKRSSYLEGVDLNTGQNLTWSGTCTSGWHEGEGGEIVYDTATVTNARFGAQAWAETMCASKVASHSSFDMTAGPCYGIPDVTGSAYYDKYQQYCSKDGENVGMGNGGEGGLIGAGRSALHWGSVIDGRFKSIGCGYANGYVCINFSQSLME